MQFIVKQEEIDMVNYIQSILLGLVIGQGVFAVELSAIVLKINSQWRSPTHLYRHGIDVRSRIDTW